MSNQQRQSQTGEIVVTVFAGGVRLNRELVDIGKLGERLSLLSRIAPDKVIFVRGEKGLEFRKVAEVIDIANGAGLNRVALMTE